jgi:hypothetical protein
MSIDAKYSDLIQADIDGEISVADKAELDAFLAESEEGRALHAEFATLAGSLDEIGELVPPTHLKHVILNQAPVRSAPAKQPIFVQRLLVSPALGYVGTFAAGVILALALVSSDQISTGAFDDMTGLVGTIADVENIGPSHDTVAIDEAEIAGTVTLRSNGPMLILDFDLAAVETVQIIAKYSDQTIWFNGFAQLESNGTTVAAETGTVTLEMDDGKRRYAVFLNNPGNRPAIIEMQFVARNGLIHEANLEFGR